MHAWVVAARLHHGALELIGHDGARYAAEERESARDASDEVGHLLRPSRLCVRVVARAEDGDEQLDLDDLTRLRLNESRPHPCVVDEHLVTRDVRLAHHGRAPLLPHAVALAERGVAQPLRLRREVLHVEQRERHPRPSQLDV